MSFFSLNDKKFLISVKGKNLVFDRENVNNFKLIDQQQIDSEFSNQKTGFINFLGFYEITMQKFAVFSTNVELISQFWNIHYIKNYEIVQISPGKINEEAISLLKRGLDKCSMYYSLTNDLTLNLHLIQQKYEETRYKFIWNYNAKLAFETITNEKEFVTPVVAGFMTASSISDSLEFLLISRRSFICAGSRSWMKGANDNGDVANYVETEQILIAGDKQYSLVQIRGSIPIRFTEYPDLNPMPPMKIADKSINLELMNKHFDHLLVDEHFDKVYAINLAGTTGVEGAVSKVFSDLSKEINKKDSLEYIEFDFHKVCGQLHFERLPVLLDQLTDKLENDAWTEITTNRVQKKVFRTNCIECMDRTNLVQAEIGRLVIERQLKEIGSTFDILEHEFRKAWANNCDAIAFQYNGTVGLKTDFTLTGKRSKEGFHADLRVLLKRVYRAQAQDGLDQDAYDVVTQNVKANSLKRESLLVSLIFAILMCIWALLLLLTFQKKKAKRVFSDARIRVGNTPRFTPIKPASD